MYTYMCALSCTLFVCIYSQYIYIYAHIIWSMLCNVRCYHSAKEWCKEGLAGQTLTSCNIIYMQIIVLRVRIWIMILLNPHVVVCVGLPY